MPPNAPMRRYHPLRSKAMLPLLMLACTGPALADRPECSTSATTGTPYCQYRGLVSRSYVSQGGAVLMHFDTAFASAAEVTIPNVTVLNACLVQVDQNQNFAKMFYASALMAQASGKTVTVQMRGSADGYPLCDRIWVNN
jgi:predicted membrane-bound mannosyltransferase